MSILDSKRFVHPLLMVWELVPFSFIDVTKALDDFYAEDRKRISLTDVERQSARD